MSGWRPRAHVLVKIRGQELIIKVVIDKVRVPTQESLRVPHLSSASDKEYLVFLQQ